jgi:hypothetical protein
MVMAAPSIPVLFLSGAGIVIAALALFAAGVFVGVEGAGGNEGTVCRHLLGGTDSGAGGQLAGHGTIALDGYVAPIEVTPGHDPRSDPGSPAHLGTNSVPETPG